MALCGRVGHGPLVPSRRMGGGFGGGGLSPLWGLAEALHVGDAHGRLRLQLMTGTVAEPPRASFSVVPHELELAVVRARLSMSVPFVPSSRCAIPSWRSDALLLQPSFVGGSIRFRFSHIFGVEWRAASLRIAWALPIFLSLS